MKRLGPVVLILATLIITRATAQEKLTVKVVLDPPTLYAGDRLTVTAQTTPGASCTMTIRFRAGAWTAPSRTADESGKAIWTPSTAQRNPQQAEVSVDCTLNSQKGSGSAQLTIR